ncbi:MAG: 3-phosphoshikimate 1-carboxyvinyltransferase [Lachnospiraceae bacterium]|nr:3-phosphoshikimate 1-carboxyvinyltransferase [Lachnospiraceae bacterium]
MRVAVPGSKSITNRALLMAALASGESVLRGCMASEDARVFLEALKSLGFDIKEEPAADAGLVKNIDVRIKGCDGVLPKKEASVYVGSAGTAARFLLAMLAFSEGEYALDASEQMKKRPMTPLIEVLREAGAEVLCTEKEGHFPLRVRGCGGMLPDSLTVDISQSSQFLSALLIAAATLSRPLTLKATGDHGLAYVEMSAKMLAAFGVHVKREGLSFIFDGKERLTGCDYEVEPDASAAAYFYALGALLGREACVPGMKKEMLQGDTAFLGILERMGCRLKDEQGELILIGPAEGKLSGGFEADMSACSDQALTLAAIAPFADGAVTIRGIAHIRLQECDRIDAMVRNLTALGIKCGELEDGIRILPGRPHPAELESFGDHRVAMSFALTKVLVPGIEIKDKECCKKTFAEYFEVLEKALAY